MYRVYYKSSFFNSLLEHFPPTQTQPFSPAQGRIERVPSTAWAIVHCEIKILKLLHILYQDLTSYFLELTRKSQYKEESE